MHIRLWVSIVALSLLATVTGCGASSSATNIGSSKNVPQRWFTTNASQKTAYVKLEANYNGTDDGMNFDGYSNGNMTITVSQGWKVIVTFSNDSSMMVHSAMIVSYKDRTNAIFSPTSLAFKGASTPDPDLGTQNGQTQTFTFTANKSGKYAIVCAIPGHAARGMWDTLIVAK